MSDTPSKLNFSRVFRLLRYGVPYWRRWVFIVLLTFALSGAAILAPWPMQVLVDYVLGDKPVPPALARVLEFLPGSSSAGMMILWVVFAEIALFGLLAALDALHTLSFVRAGQRMVYDLATDLFDYMQRRSLLFHTRNTVGDLLARITGDSWGVYGLVDLLLLAPVKAIIMIATMVALMLSMDWKLTLLAVAVAPFMAGSSLFFGAPLRIAAMLRREVESRLITHVQQTLAGIPVVQAFAQEDREEQRFREFADAAIGAHRRSTFASQSYALATGFIGTVGRGAVLWFGVRQVLAGSLSLGGLWVFLAYLAMLHEQMRVFVNGYGALQTVSANADRVIGMLEEPTELIEAPNAVSIQRARGDIRLESITFGYEPDRPVLKGIDLHIKPGSTVAVVGSSGAGKSTLVSLVPRFFDPWQGRVLLDGADVKSLNLRDLREQVAIVLQEPFLFPLTVAQNIAYGRPDATRQQIEAAARAAGAHAFIAQLAKGYDTMLGERGATLSGGERQRLSIARALLKDAPILILDEPTASLDAATEATLLEALDLLMEGRTTLVIAHRLSTIRDADRIIVLDDGQIAEEGTHEQLLLRGGIYAEMHASQTGRRRKPVVLESST